MTGLHRPRAGGLASRLAAIVAAAALVLAACGGGSDGDGAVGEAVGVNEAGGEGGKGSEGSGGEDGTSGSGKGDGRSNGPANGATGGESGEGAGPTRTDIPEPGRYTYELTSPSSDRTSERFLDVDDTGERRGDVRQLHSTHRGSPDGTRQMVVWIEGGEHHGLWIEAEQRSRGGQVSPLCLWNPTYAAYEMPMSTGAQWRWEATCDEKHEDGETTTRRRTVTAKVRGERRVKVGNVEVTAWEIERRTETASSPSPGLDLVDRIDAVELFVPTEGLVVRSEERYTTVVNGVPDPGDTVVATLRSLQPEPLDRQG